MMSGVPFETCWAFKKLRNNKFYYKAASYWYFYWVIYDARIHEYQSFVHSYQEEQDLDWHVGLHIFVIMTPWRWHLGWMTIWNISNLFSWHRLRHYQVCYEVQYFLSPHDTRLQLQMLKWLSWFQELPYLYVILDVLTRNVQQLQQDRQRSVM